VAGGRGPVLLPVRWLAVDAALDDARRSVSLALAAAGPEASVALTVDEAWEWRAGDLVGAMVQGTASIHVLDALGSGAKTARAIATALHPGAGALVRNAPERRVGGKGWTSGSAPAA
jgi:hypothetical protein